MTAVTVVTYRLVRGGSPVTRWSIAHVPDPTLSRRRLLGAAATAGLASAAGLSTRTASAAPSKHVREERRRVVVLGTGFGGAVTALRLAQAGIDVTLIERGRRWPAGQKNTFPTFNRVDKRVYWLGTHGALFPGMPPGVLGQKYTGLIEFIKGRGMDVACAAAVGGGSLPYHGMSVQPRGDLFSQVMPAELDYDELHSVYYPRAAQMLRIGAMPQDVWDHPRYASTRAWAGFVKKAGLPDVRPLPMTIDWDVVRRELRGELPPVISRGDVIFGVNGPGKHSLDTNYLADAEATGRVELLPLHNVKALSRDDRGRWTLEVDRIDTAGRVQEQVKVTSDALFLGAGSPNTTKLLVRASARGDISGLPDGVGTKWSGNGDLIVGRLLKQKTGTWQGGPASVASTDWDNPKGPVTVLHAPMPLGVDMHVLMTVAMSIPDTFGTWQYDARRDEAILHYPNSLKGPNAREAHRRLDQVAKAAGSLATIDLTAGLPNSFHALGGATIGDVCDAHGRVNGQRGLYVVDGALIPGSTACANPSLTIAALAERNIEEIVRRDAGEVF